MITIVPTTTPGKGLYVRFADVIPEMTPEGVQQNVEGYKWGLWRLCVHDSVEDVEVHFLLAHTDSGLLIPALVGSELDTWLPYIEKWTEDYARANGLKRVYFYGRLGWLKSSRSRGWEANRVIYSREVV